MDLKLDGRTALVTGATSGIGRAIALRLADEGASVIVSGRSEERGAETVAAIRSAGGTARFVAADLADLDSVRGLATQASETDVLVNNGGAFSFGPSVEQDVAGFQAMFDVNVRATFFLSAALAPRMAARAGGSIVNITTSAAEVAVPGGAVYGASKAAVVALTRTLAVEWASDGIRVNAVSPGPILTEGTVQQIGADAVSRSGSETPIGRAGTVEEIARVVAFVASPAAGYVTGSTVHADGGQQAV